MNRKPKNSVVESRQVSKKNRSNKQMTRVTIPRGVKIMPDKILTHMSFWKAFAANLSAVTTAGFRISPSSAFSPDPLGASQFAGFTEMANFYFSYRVVASTCRVEVINPSNVTPVMVGLVPSNTDPGASPSSTTVISSIENPYAKSKTAALTGSPVTTLTNSITTQRIYGNRMVLIDDSFASLVSTNPINNWWWFVTLYSLAVIPSGISVNLFCSIDIEFYDRRRLDSN
jgi:hypothetical protein